MKEKELRQAEIEEETEAYFKKWLQENTLEEDPGQKSIGPSQKGIETVAGLFVSHMFFQILPGGPLQRLILINFRWCEDMISVLLDFGFVDQSWRGWLLTPNVAFMVSSAFMILASLCVVLLGQRFGEQAQDRPTWRAEDHMLKDADGKKGESKRREGNGEPATCSSSSLCLPWKLQRRPSTAALFVVRQM